MRTIATAFRLALLGGLLGCHAQTPPRHAQTTTDWVPAGEAQPAATAPTRIDPTVIEAAVGATPKVADDGTVKVTWAREVPVVIDGMPFPPQAGLTAWAAFAPTASGAMVMGDTVVFQDEVDAAMDAAFAQGLEVTALHNHFFFDEPKVYFMHIGGHGQAGNLATAVRHVWDAIRAVRSASLAPGKTFIGTAPVPGGALNLDAIGAALGAPVRQNGPVAKAVIGRDAVMHGTGFGASMGLTTWAAFTGSDDNAAMDGDFAMTAAEVQPVLRALRAGGIHVVALHNHMVGETPAYYFTHFWAKGPAMRLATAFRAALDAQRAAGGARN